MCGQETPSFYRSIASIFDQRSVLVHAVSNARAGIFPVIYAEVRMRQVEVVQNVFRSLISRKAASRTRYA